MDFADVTLACKNNKSVKAHKAILSGSSIFFRDILIGNPHQHPLVYLKGVEMENLQFLLEFIYLGETKIVTSQVTSFLETAKELQVSGLTEVAADDSINKEEAEIVVKEEEHDTQQSNVPHSLNESNDSENVLEETYKAKNLKETVETKIAPEGTETDNFKEVESYIYEETNSTDKLEHTVDLNTVQKTHVNKNVNCTYCSFVTQAQTKKNQEWTMKRHMEKVHSGANLIEELKTEAPAYDTNIKNVQDFLNHSRNLQEPVYTDGLNDKENVQETIEIDNKQNCHDAYSLQERIDLDLLTLPDIIVTEKLKRAIESENIQETIRGEKVETSIDVESNNEDTPACPSCGFKSNCKTKSNRQTVLKTHVKTCRGSDNNKSTAPKERNISTPETDFNDAKENTPVYSCHKCDFTTKLAKSLKRHILCVHDKIRRYSCSICDKKFSQNYDRIHHIRREHPSDVNRKI